MRNGLFQDQHINQQQKNQRDYMKDLELNPILDTLEWLYDVVVHETAPPTPSHSGSCHPDAGCDGSCADAYYMSLGMTKAYKLIQVLRARVDATKPTTSADLSPVDMVHKQIFGTLVQHVNEPVSVHRIHPNDRDYVIGSNGTLRMETDEEFRSHILCRICKQQVPTVCDDCEHKNQDFAEEAGFERGISSANDS